MKSGGAALEPAAAAAATGAEVGRAARAHPARRFPRPNPAMPHPPNGGWCSHTQTPSRRVRAQEHDLFGSRDFLDADAAERVLAPLLAAGSVIKKVGGATTAAALGGRLPVCTEGA